MKRDKLKVENMSDVLIKCFKCGKSYPTSDMRFKSSNNNDLICKYCLNKTAPPSVHPEPKQMINPVKNEGYSMPKRRVESSQVIDKMVEYKCGNCGYSFKRKSSADVSTCPYCGKSEQLQMKSAKSADSLINDSMRLG